MTETLALPATTVPVIAEADVVVAGGGAAGIAAAAVRMKERGRRIASEYWSKWYLLSDAITKNRSDGALVRLITAVSPGELERDADNRLLLFMQDLLPRLGGYLPSEAAPNSPQSSTKPRML